MTTPFNAFVDLTFGVGVGVVAVVIVVVVVQASNITFSGEFTGVAYTDGGFTGDDGGVVMD